MKTVGVLEARNNLSQLIREVEDGTQDAVIIKRNERPVVKIVAFDSNKENTSRRIGIAKGKILYSDDWDSPEFNSEIADLFEGAL